MIHLPICLSVRPPLCLSVCPALAHTLSLSLSLPLPLPPYLSFFQPIYTSIYLSTYLPVYLSTCIYLFILPSIHLSYLSLPHYLSSSLWIYPSLCQCLGISVSVFFFLPLSLSLSVVCLSISLSLFIPVLVSISIFYSIHPSTQLSIYLSIHPSVCKKASMWQYVGLPSKVEVDRFKKRRVSPRPPQKWKSAAPKRRNSARHFQKLDVGNIKNETSFKADGLAPMRLANLPSRLSKLLRLPRKSEARSYKVLHLSRKIILANLMIWWPKTQPLWRNLRPNLRTCLMDMSLVPLLPREMHLCRSSPNPRLP